MLLHATSLLASQTPRQFDGFQLSSFLGGMAFLGFFAVIFGLPFFLITLKVTGRDQVARLFSGTALSLVAGMFSTIAWLSWSRHRSLVQTLEFGFPNYYEVWQVIGCGLTVIALSVLITLKFANHFMWIPLIAFFFAFGFATAFTAGVSFGPPSQEGIGVFLSLIGVSISVFLISGVTFIIRENRNLRSQATGGR
ncbi:hypothetical protein CPHO_00175 [Corynebacterium phocae]|uniref:Uncharacterized protein n=1 Tax=Corynebacterium phocae TaxID=161895 RepID=A0A1L7D0D8_9CORY|nr:hypothetical protein [Corynebacterium phocae]APT91609.1 hypothetical protein CPHO_00175 [Corynebacterium phocae]KAA8720679.1 hypothetical protein F4V58_12030 [Corynebacterium phocae]